MIFTSLEFLALFVIILIVRIQIKNLNTEKWFLLIVSWLFYMSWNAPFVILLIAVSTSDYFLGRQIHHAPNPSVKKFLMASSLVIDLGIIGFFKYATLTLESWRQIIALAGIQSDPVFVFYLSQPQLHLRHLPRAYDSCCELAGLQSVYCIFPGFDCRANPQGRRFSAPIVGTAAPDALHV